jgi:hypothetical protein
MLLMMLQASDSGVAASARKGDAQVLPGQAAGVGSAESTVSWLSLLLALGQALFVPLCQVASIGQHDALHAVL